MGVNRKPLHLCGGLLLSHFDHEQITSASILNCLIYKMDEFRLQCEYQGKFLPYSLISLARIQWCSWQEYTTFYILHEMPTILFSLVAETLRKPSKQQIQGLKFQGRANNRGNKLLFFIEKCVQHRPAERARLTPVLNSSSFLLSHVTFLSSFFVAWDHIPSKPAFHKSFSQTLLSALLIH